MEIWFYTSRSFIGSILRPKYLGIIDCHNGYVYNGRSGYVHVNGISCLINLDKDRIASGGKDQSIKIWNVNNGITCLDTLYEHDAAFYCFGI
jgi:WD40 repeat protein